jgi:6-phosphogluconolactonase
MRSLACLVVVLTATTASADTFVYVSVAGDKRIAIFRMDTDKGSLTHSADVTTTGEPGALTTDPNKRFLFAALRSTGELASFRIEPKTGNLTHVNTVPAGPDPAHLSTDRTGRFLLTAYYVAGKVTVHEIGPDATLSEKPLQTVNTAEKAHAVVPDPSNRFVFVPHTGPNLIFQFAFRTDTGKLAPSDPVKLTTPDGSGPRHLVFNPSKDIAYVDNEQGGSVTAYALDGKAGTLKQLHTVSTLPRDFRGSNACAEIKVHPTGKFLFVSNRGHDSIACFTIDAKDGRLTPVGQVATEKTPRSFDLDPSGTFLLAAGESSGKLAVYRVDQDTGGLTRSATYELGKQPWWVLAIDVPAK